MCCIKITSFFSIIIFKMSHGMFTCLQVISFSFLFWNCSKMLCWSNVLCMVIYHSFIKRIFLFHSRGEHKTLSSWARLPGQTCRIPNTLHATLPAGRKGCFVLRFSHDGRSLACACNDRDQYPIYIYEVSTVNRGSSNRTSAQCQGPESMSDYGHKWTWDVVRMPSEVFGFLYPYM